LVRRRAGENGVLANEDLAAQSRADQAQAGVLAQQNEGVGCIHAATLTSWGESWQGLLGKRRFCAEK
jgi:cytochrome c551/c552